MRNLKNLFYVSLQTKENKHMSKTKCHRRLERRLENERHSIQNTQSNSFVSFHSINAICMMERAMLYSFNTFEHDLFVIVFQFL